jgi:hypothetical protein
MNFVLDGWFRPVLLAKALGLGFDLDLVHCNTPSNSRAT